MARGCALIDSRLDTAKICSDGRVHVDHAQLPAVFGGEKTFSHGLGQKRKSRPCGGMSALPPILLKKSFLADEQKFSGPLMRSAGGGVRDPIAFRKKTNKD